MVFQSGDVPSYETSDGSVWNFSLSTVEDFRMIFFYVHAAQFPLTSLLRNSKSCALAVACQLFRLPQRSGFMSNHGGLHSFLFTHAEILRHAGKNTEGQ